VDIGLTTVDGGRRVDPYVAVIGPGEARESDLVVAEQVGAGLADAGAIVVCGGLGGVMEAACRGASDRGGLTVGLLPGRDRVAGNPYLSIVLPTGLGELRNGLVVATADGVIAVGGSWGTLSELALAMKAGKPVVAVGGWELAAPNELVPTITTAADADEAVAWVLAAIG
jgi:uncharacterized protein (TIGR00725 family)